MQNQSLNGFWQVHQVDKGDWLHASVPGCVHLDLITAGKLVDPFPGTSEKQVQWVAGKNWEYRHFFHPRPDIFRQEKIWLVCEGLDTLAEVRLNGNILGQADNMFRTWQWEIKNRLLEGENKLEILFRSPLNYIRARQRVKPMQDMPMGIRGGSHLRKTPSHFGWDWGPRLPLVGIWQEVGLIGYSRGRLGEIRFEQDHSTPGIVTLTARVQSEIWENSEQRHTVRLCITGPDRQVWQLDAPARPQTGANRTAKLTVTIPNPQLWWPNGYGPSKENAQPLYQIDVELLSGEDERIDSRKFNLGLRTIELRQEADDVGRSFTFVVNGQPIFCKGANWIPADSFPTRVTPERLENLIRAAAETHQNMLRVWGGGYYEQDAFYELCDRYGILVWQDFQFACATYPLDDQAYLENVRGEVVENVRRLRHHPSLALWCGNNEVEWLSTMLGWHKRKPALAEAYRRFFFEQLPELLADEDPGRAYWPGSPSSNDPFNAPNSETTGDAHLWDVFSAYRPPSHYRKHTPRFVSEFGFQALPAVKTVAAFAPAQAWQITSPEMRMHQRHPGGSAKLTWYLAQRFRLPRTFEGLVYLTQVFQAEAIRTGIEHWRRSWPRTSGTLYWQLNDCWPVISWSSIDYFGRWKALHYAARRFYAPLLLSIEDNPAKDQRKMAVWITNDRCEAWEGRIHWTLETLEGEVIEGGNKTVLSPPQSAECQLTLDFFKHNGKVNWRRAIFVAELWQGETLQALQVAPFVLEKDLALDSPQLSVEASEAEGLLQVQVTAQKLARFVEVSLQGADAVFSDNYFDLPARRSVTVDCALPEGWTIEQAQAALQVRSLAEIGLCETAFTSHWKGDMAFIGSLLEMAWTQAIKPLLGG